MPLGNRLVPLGKRLKMSGELSNERERLAFRWLGTNLPEGFTHMTMMRNTRAPPAALPSTFAMKAWRPRSIAAWKFKPVSITLQDRQARGLNRELLAN